MTITVKLFGPQAALVGAGEVQVEVDEPATGPLIRDALRVAAPALRDSLGGSRLAVDHEYVDDDARIDGNREVALIGMVSGG